MKRYNSYCTNENCPFTDCERHHTNNKNGYEAYDFRGTCVKYREYYTDSLNSIAHKKLKGLINEHRT